MKSNENQKTFDALPIEVTESALTANQKSLLEVFVLLDGLERTKENGYFFASNADLMLKSGIGSHHTLAKVIRTFELYKFITRTVGSFEGRQATTYSLDMEAVMNWCEAHPIGAVSKRRKSAPIKSAPIMGAVSQKCPDEMSAKVIEMERKINELEAVNKALIEALSKCGIEAVKEAIIGAGIGAVLEGIAEKCPTDTETEKEITYHSVPSSNSSMGLPICAREENDNDEIAPSNGGDDQTGSVCDFQKIEGHDPAEVEQSQPEKATPDDEQTTIEYLTKLEKTLRDINTNLNHDEVIELAGKLSAILDKWGQSSNVGNLTIDRSANLINWFVDDLTTLAEVRDIFGSHLRQDNGNTNPIAHNLIYRYGILNPQDAGNAQIWAMSTSNVQTTIQSGETRQDANKGANPVSGVNHSNANQTAQSGETSPEPHQSVENVRVITYTSQSDEHAQTRPDEAEEPMQAVECIKAELTVWGRCEFDIHDDEMAETTADNAVNNLTKLIGCIKTVAELNWCDYYIGRAFKNWGWVLGTRYEMYHTNITRQLTAKRNELAA